MPHFRLARISLILAAIGLNAAPALLTSAHAQAKPDPAAAAAAPKPDTVRPELFKLLDPAKTKELMAAKNFKQLSDNIAAAEAFPNRTPYEDYVLNRIKLALGSSSGNDKMAMDALEFTINSGRLDKKDQGEFINALANYYYNAKNYPKAIEWFKRHQTETGSPDKVRPSLVRSYYLSNDFAAAKAELAPMIKEMEAAGKTPSLEDLRLLASTAGKLKDMNLYGETMEKLVENYPTDDFWTDLLRRMQSKPGFNNKLILDVYRLESLALKEMAPEEYMEMAELALMAGFFTEAKQAMDAGFSKNVLGTGSYAAKHKELRARATKGAADDAKTIANGEAAAMKAKDGLPLVNLGYAYVTMDQFDKGIDLMEKGMAKGGIKQLDMAKLRLGTAYVKAGRKADAIKVFETLKGNDGMGDLARYWIMYINGPKVAAAAPAAATK